MNLSEGVGWDIKPDMIVIGVYVRNRSEHSLFNLFLYCLHVGQRFPFFPFSTFSCRFVDLFASYMHIVQDFYTEVACPL